MVPVQDEQIEEEGALPKKYVPEGFKTAEAFLEYARKEYADDSGYDRQNREAALDDLKFVGMDQWDPVVRAARQAQGRPCLTINVLPQYIGQVIGDRRINKTAIKVRPRKGATQEQAEIRSGIIKSIEAYSRAERVYDAACEDQVTCGIGNFRIAMDYADNDVFDQDIFVRQIPNPLAVVWDRMSTDPTGRDARHCFVQDSLPKNVYEEMFPDFPAPSDMGDDMVIAAMAQGWFDKDVVRITEFWRMTTKKRRLALMNDGDVKDITDMTPEQYGPELWVDPATGQPRIRQADRTYAQMHLITGTDILEGPYELPITRLPIIKVTGREVRVGDDRVRFGLVRFAKDSQRLKNYWRSVAAEALALAPKSQWIAPEDAVEGLQDEFRNAHISGDPLLVYKKNATVPPTRVDPPPVPAALLMEANLNAQDIKDVTGLHDASLGVRSNEVSGKAINARQREGDIATVIYHDNLNASIQEGGDVINQLIPICYDTVRTLRVIGDDDKHKLMKVNDPRDDNSPDITSGKYDISLETGPSYTTQRMEAADAMIQAIQVAPQLMEVAGDLIVKAQDWPGAVEISERLKKAMPPQLTQEEGAELSPEQQKAQQEQAQQAEQMQLVQQAALAHEAEMGKLQLEEMQAKVATAKANALQATADADKAKADAQKAQVEADAAPVRVVHEMDLAERAASDKSAAAKAAIKNRSAGPRPGADRNPKGKRP